MPKALKSGQSKSPTDDKRFIVIFHERIYRPGLLLLFYNCTYSLGAVFLFTVILESNKSVKYSKQQDSKFERYNVVYS